MQQTPQGLRTFYCFAVLLLVVNFAGAAHARTPLVQEGKTSVYQRIVTHPGAVLYAGAEPTAAVQNNNVRTFTAMYVYGVEGGRMEVGVASNKADGWIDAKAATIWPQAITMLFTDRMGRAPVLFFRDHKALEETCQAASVRDTVQGYAATLKKASPLPADYPVVASEPESGAVSEKNFYLLPVVDIDRQYAPTAGLNLLEVASINPGIAKEDTTQASNAAASSQAELHSGIVFVIDTTISMKPYIDQTLKLVRSIYDELEKNPHGDKIAFAVVAFRSSTARTAGLEYTSKVISDFKGVQQRAELEKALEQVQEATVSTHDFNEDSFAGVKEAADSLSWNNYGARVMLLVTDAGPLREGDPTSSTGLSPEALADYLRTNKIYLTALHVQSPSGAKNHASAAESYRILTKQADNKASYIPLDASTAKVGAASFDRVGRTLASAYSQVVTATAQGQFMEDPSKSTPTASTLTPEAEAARIAASTGYAMQLQFFGNQQGNTAPQVVKAWIADADLEKLEASSGAPVLAAVPAVLLTKGQLSRLREQLKVLLQTGEEAFLRGNGEFNFFEQLRSAAAQMSRDPSKFSASPDQNLMASGMLEEVLSGLPYVSMVGGLTQRDWEAMSTGARQKFLNRIKGLVARYEEYDRDRTHWESFGSPNADDWVYRVPLDMLP